MNQDNTLESVNDLLNRIESDVEEKASELQKTQSGIDKLMLVFFSLIGIFALFNLYYLYGWGQEVKSIVYEMTTMQQHVQNMSGQMSSINQTMQTLEDKTGLIPIMNEEMGKFVSSMTQMSNQTHQMNQDMQTLNQSMRSVTADFSKLNGQMNGLNQQIGQMNQSVSEMSKIVP